MNIAIEWEEDDIKAIHLIAESEKDKECIKNLPIETEFKIKSKISAFYSPKGSVEQIQTPAMILVKKV